MPRIIMKDCNRRATASFLLALACVSLTTAPASGRRLNAWDAWPTVPMCPGQPTANSAKDGSGRLWGFANGGSCAFKDEQQQALYPNVATPKQDWSTAPACGEAPSAFNSAPDSLNRLWGVGWSKSCAFRTASGEPIYYTGYAGAKYSPPRPPPSPSPSPSPRPVPRPASPSPVPAALPTLPAQQPAVPTPSPAPATGSSPACIAQPPTIMLNSTAVADAVVTKLWEKFSYSTNGYEGTLRAAEGPTAAGTTASDSNAKLARTIVSILQLELMNTKPQTSPKDVQAAQNAAVFVTSELKANAVDSNASLPVDTTANTTVNVLPTRPTDPVRKESNETSTRLCRHMLASPPKPAGVTEPTHTVAINAEQGASVPTTSSRHVLQEVSSRNNTAVVEKAGVPEVAAVQAYVPEDNITVFVPIQPPPGHGPRDSAGSTNATTELLLSTQWEDAPSEVKSTWQDAPACLGAPNANNTSKDNMGRLWGWESGKSCAVKDAAGLPLFPFELAPVCKSVIGTSRDERGRLWGWENGMSCKILHIVNP